MRKILLRASQEFSHEAITNAVGVMRRKSLARKKINPKKVSTKGGRLADNQ
jgi:hypothetical protein